MGNGAAEFLDRGAEFDGGLVSVLGFFGEGFDEEGVEFRSKVRAVGCDGLVEQNDFAGEHLVEKYGKTVQVGAMVDSLGIGALFGCAVVNFPDMNVCARETRILPRDSRRPKIQDADRIVVLHNDVVRRDVPVNGDRVNLLDRIAYSPHHLDRPPNLHRAFLSDDAGYAVSFGIFHGIEQHVPDAARIVDLDDAGMMDFAHHLHFAHEAFECELVLRDFRSDNFERDFCFACLVANEVHDASPALAEHFDDLEAIADYIALLESHRFYILSITIYFWVGVSTRNPGLRLVEAHYINP